MVHETELSAISIPHAKLKYGNKINEGGFGIVYQATYVFDKVAIKVLKSQDLLTEEVKKEFIAESKVMNTLRSEFIVQLRGVCLEPNHLSLVMEYLPTASQYNLGWCYDNGQGVTQDREQAVYWYQKAAEQGFAAAQTNLENLLKAQPSLRNSLSSNANPSFFKPHTPESKNNTPKPNKQFGN